MKAAVSAYLARLDAHLAGVAAPMERIRLIDDERWRVDRLERALSDWAARRGGRAPPTRFSAFDLAVLHGELSMRLEAARDAA
jgi:hypothetical protein